MMMEDDWKLIHYFEDGRNELYHLGNDIGEKFDIAVQHPLRVAEMEAAVMAWQKEVGAASPTGNPKFNAKQREGQLVKLEAEGNPKREAQHAEFMKADYVPGGGWWDQPKAPKIKD